MKHNVFFGISRRKVKIAILVVIVLVFLVWLFWRPVIWLTTPDVSEIVKKGFDGYGCILDREGKILRLFPNDAGDFMIYSPIGSFSKTLKDAIFAAEDRRFYYHAGFDPWAIFRAIWLDMKSRKIVSGASTITQQLIRLARPRPRTIMTKISELFMAAKLEMQWNKEKILEAYLNLIPMSGNLRGVGIGAQILFAKNVDVLSTAEAATLAAIPQSPSRLDPDSSKGAKLLLARRNWILREMKEISFIDGETASRSIGVSLGTRKKKYPCLAPHFVDWVVENSGNPHGSIVTSLDSQIQSKLESVLYSHKGRLARCGARQTAAMILDTRTMQILAMAGSFYYGMTEAGFNNGCTAPRSGGSILKPFLYALALEKGYTPSSVIPDTSQNYKTPKGDYLPYNADRRSYGPVTIRSALGNSLNISAVKMLNALGIKPFFQFLVDLGVFSMNEAARDKYGLGLAIGNPEVKLIALAQAYGALANQGRKVAITYKLQKPNFDERLFSESTAFLILDILSDPSARLLTFGNPKFFAFEFPVAIKTGTSTNFRDEWLFAVTPRLIIGIWVGNFDGSPTFGLSGATACGPIIHDLFEEIMTDRNKEWFNRPNDIVAVPVCGISGLLPSVFCPAQTVEMFKNEQKPSSLCSFHTGTNNRHELPPEYSDWIQSRRTKGITDPFILANGLEVTNPLMTGNLFTDGKRGVRLVNPIPQASTGFLFSVPIATFTSRLVVKSNEVMETGEGRLYIISPHNGDRFIMIPGEENITRLRVNPEKPIAEIIWLVDDVEIARVGPPYETFWELTHGEHTITALGPGEEAAQIQITVE